VCLGYFNGILVRFGYFSGILACFGMFLTIFVVFSGIFVLCGVGIIQILLFSCVDSRVYCVDVFALILGDLRGNLVFWCALVVSLVF